MKTLQIIGIPGSLRQKSFNRMLMNTAIETLGEDCKIELATIQDIPLYNQDDEDHRGIPDAVKTLQDLIASSDGLLIATPEYNASIPGVFKNAIDWLSRPPKEIPRVFTGLPVGMMGITPGGRGTYGAQTAWLPVWRALQVKLYSGSSLTLSKASDIFDENGGVKDPKVQKQISDFMKGFVEFVRENKRK